MTTATTSTKDAAKELTGTELRFILRETEALIAIAQRLALPLLPQGNLPARGDVLKGVADGTITRDDIIVAINAGTIKTTQEERAGIRRILQTHRIIGQQTPAAARQERIKQATRPAAQTEKAEKPVPVYPRLVA